MLKFIIQSFSLLILIPISRDFPHLAIQYTRNFVFFFIKKEVRHILLHIVDSLVHLWTKMFLYPSVLHRGTTARNFHIHVCRVQSKDCWLSGRGEGREARLVADCLRLASSLLAQWRHTDTPPHHMSLFSIQQLRNSSLFVDILKSVNLPMSTLKLIKRVQPSGVTRFFWK